MARSRTARYEVDVYQCEGQTKAGPQCKRRIKGRTLCYQHTGNAVDSGVKRAPSGRQGTATTGRRRRKPSTTTGQASVARVEELLKTYRELAQEGWRGTLADKLSSHLGDEIWDGVDSSWKAEDCESLAKAAQALEKLAGKAGQVESVLDKPGVKTAVSASAVATAIVGRVGVARQQTDKLVLTIRITGIALCEMRGRLGDCQCLKDLADDVVPGALEAKLDQVCETYLAQV